VQNRYEKLVTKALTLVFVLSDKRFAFAEM